MKLVVALGNIGREYAGTRHNIGFMTADILASRWGDEDAWRKADNAAYLEKRMPEKCWVIKPTTYMNNSGVAVADFANFYHIPPEDVLVIQDDMDLPVGTLRIRRKGSSGGHNGLKSIERALGSQAYPRIKVGIGHPVHQEQADQPRAPSLPGRGQGKDPGSSGTGRRCGGSLDAGSRRGRTDAAVQQKSTQKGRP